MKINYKELTVFALLITIILSVLWLVYTALNNDNDPELLTYAAIAFYGGGTVTAIIANKFNVTVFR